MYINSNYSLQYVKEPALKLPFHDVNFSGTRKSQLRQDKIWFPCKLNGPKAMRKEVSVLPHQLRDWNAVMLKFYCLLVSINI